MSIKIIRRVVIYLWESDAFTVEYAADLYRIDRVELRQSEDGLEWSLEGRKIQKNGRRLASAWTLVYASGQIPERIRSIALAEIATFVRTE